MLTASRAQSSLSHTHARAQYASMIHTKMPMPTRWLLRRASAQAHAARNLKDKIKTYYFLESIKNIWENPSI